MTKLLILCLGISSKLCAFTQMVIHIDLQREYIFLAELKATEILAFKKLITLVTMFFLVQVYCTDWVCFALSGLFCAYL